MHWRTKIGGRRASPGGRSNLSRIPMENRVGRRLDRPNPVPKPPLEKQQRKHGLKK